MINDKEKLQRLREVLLKNKASIDEALLIIEEMADEDSNNAEEVVNTENIETLDLLSKLSEKLILFKKVIEENRES